MLKPEVDRMRGLLVEAITTLCRSGLQYNSNLKVEGLIGITLDEADIILVNLNRSFGSVMDNNIKRKRKRKRRKTRNTDSTGSESESSESDRDDTSVTRDQSSAGARRTDESFDLNNTNTQPDVSPESGDTSSHIPDSLPRDKRVPALGEAAETHSSPQTGALTQGNGTSPNDSKAVIKIEIDSDAEVEEVKYEPGQKTDLWNVSMSAQSCPMSDGLTLQTDMSSRLAGIPGGVENTPEFLQSHLPPELAAETQQDRNLQSSYFSGPQPVPGPSGFAMATPGGSTYSPDMQSSMVFPVQTNSQKIKAVQQAVFDGTVARIHHHMAKPVSGPNTGVCSNGSLTGTEEQVLFESLPVDSTCDEQDEMDPSTASSGRIRTITADKYARIIRCLTNPDGEPDIKFSIWMKKFGFVVLNDAQCDIRNVLLVPKQTRWGTSQLNSPLSEYLVVPAAEDLGWIINKYHVDGGHAGILKTHRALLANYAFVPRTIVSQVLQGCQVCAKRKMIFHPIVTTE